MLTVCLIVSLANNDSTSKDKYWSPYDSIALIILATSKQSFIENSLAVNKYIPTNCLPTRHWQVQAVSVVGLNFGIVKKFRNPCVLASWALSGIVKSNSAFVILFLCL